MSKKCTVCGQTFQPPVVTGQPIARICAACTRRLAAAADRRPRRA